MVSLAAPVLILVLSCGLSGAAGAGTAIGATMEDGTCLTEVMNNVEP